MNADDVKRIYDKLRLALPFLNGSDDQVLEWAKTRYGKFYDVVPVVQANAPQYLQIFQNMVGWRECFQTCWDFTVPRCADSYAQGLYSDITTKTMTNGSEVDDTVSVSVIHETGLLGQLYNNHFVMPVGISMTNGTPVTRNDYQELQNSVCSVLNRQMVGWVPETFFPVVGPFDGGAPLPQNYPVTEWLEKFGPVLEGWADKQLELWRIGGLDIDFRYKITGGTWTLSTTETFRATLVDVKSVYDSGTGSYLTAKAPIIYPTGGTAQASFQNGSVLYTGNWGREFSFQVTTNCAELMRGTSALRLGTSSNYPAQAPWPVVFNQIQQKTWAEPVSQSYTPCLSYFITGLSSADERMYWRRVCHIPETSTWPTSANNIWIEYSGNSATHYFSEIMNRDLTDQMTDTYQVYQLTTEMKITNPYKYPIEVKLVIQKAADDSDLWTNHVDQGLYSERYAELGMRWQSGLTFAFPTPYAKSWGSSGAEGVALRSSTITDPNQMYNGPCAIYEGFYETNQNDGAYTTNIQSGWGLEVNNVTQTNANCANVINAYFQDLWETTTMTITLDPGESYILTRPPAPVWTGSMNCNPFTSQATMPQSAFHPDSEFFPGDMRRAPESVHGNHINYTVNYCWRPLVKEEE